MSAVGQNEITTLEGLGTANAPHPIQQAFIDEQAAQCGFCLSGVVLTAKTFLDTNPRATDEQIQQALSGVLCRCFANVRHAQGHPALRQWEDGMTPHLTPDARRALGRAGFATRFPQGLWRDRRRVLVGRTRRRPERRLRAGLQWHRQRPTGCLDCDRA